MFDALRQLHHLPGCLEDGFIALGLPELDIELAAGKFTLQQPRFPF
jgi:hypothetical protein